MGMLRYQTYYAGSFLIDQMRYHGIITEMLHDGGDIVLFKAYSGETISIHLIDSSIQLYEVRNTLEDNASKGYYSLFMLWSTMMLPNHGQRYVAEDWMEALFSLHKNHIYGYDYIDGQAYIYPVYFHGQGKLRDVEYGTVVRVKKLKCRTVSTGLPGLQGEWLIADFDGEVPQVVVGKEMMAYYEVLGVLPGDDLDTIKRAYRLLARRYHPDSNPSPQANEQMQRLNEAYQKVTEAMD